MTVLAAILAATLAAPAAGPGSTSPPSPSATDGQEALRAQLARELPALAPRAFRTPSGIAGRVEAAAEPRVEALEGGEAELLSVPLGTGAELTCAVSRTRVDAAAAIWSTVEEARKKVKVVSAMPVDVLEVKGSALVLAQVAYQLEGERGPLLGVLKLAVHVHPGRSLLCRHDEPGYGESFARIVKGLAASLAGGGPDERTKAIFAELSVVRIGPLAVGYAEHVVWRRPGGGLVAEQRGSQILPRGPGDLVAIDSSSVEELDGKDLLQRGSYAHVSNGELDLRMSVARGEDGRSYAYEGEKDGKRLSGTFRTRAGLSTDLWFARRLSAVTPPRGPLSHEAYSVESNPVAPVPVVYRLDPAAPRRATMELGPLKLTGDLDAHGLFASAEVPVGPATLVVKRLHARGAP